MLKTIAYVILGLVICTVFFPTISADPAVVIDSYILYPEIFMPGDTGMLSLTIKNSEITNTEQTTTTGASTTTTTTNTVGATISDIWIVEASDGKHRLKSTQVYRDVGDLAPGASMDISFNMIAEDNITEGLYFPTARVNVVTYADVRFPISIKVSNATVDLILTDVPSRISKSGSTLLTLTAVNNRGNSVDTVTIVPQSLDGLEFTPKSVFVGTLDSHASSEASFSIKTNDVGEYNVSFTVNFKNGDNLHSETINHTIEVVETLDVAPVFISVPSTIEKGKSGRVSLEVYNAKTESITGVIVTPITDTIVTPSQYFIGAMDPDDVFSASFDVSTENLDYGNYTICFKVTFKQENEYYETPTIISTFSVIQASENNVGGGLVIPIFFLIIIIVIVILVFYLRKR